jgi:hypothetical protein
MQYDSACIGYDDGNYTNAAMQQKLTAVQTKTFDRCLADANAIREQVAECAKMAASIQERLGGSYPEEGCENAAKELPTGGAIGELTRIQTGTFGFISDLRRTLDRISKHI